MPASAPRNSEGNLVFQETLLNAQVITATVNGTAISGWSQVKAAKLHLTVASIGGTSPNYTVKLQDSVDGTNWVDVASGAFSAVTANGTTSLVLPNPVVLGDSVRVVVTVTGTTPTAAVTLVCTSISHSNI